MLPRFGRHLLGRLADDLDQLRQSEDEHLVVVQAALSLPSTNRKAVATASTMCRMRTSSSGGIQLLRRRSDRVSKVPTEVIERPQ
ncbi:MAG TPA: hypothetical protein VGO60_08795, partial [Iamia sp.]|nr:hypothetical protein [Iamia sp.]